jgi:hypothetical protein
MSRVITHEEALALNAVAQQIATDGHVPGAFLDALAERFGLDMDTGVADLIRKLVTGEVVGPLAEAGSKAAKR